MAIIPTENPLSLWAYYCGFGALVPGFGLFLGPAALVLGVKAVRAANERPEIEGKGHALVGVVLGAIASLLHFGFLALIVFGAAVG